MEVFNWISKSEEETIELGKQFAQFLHLKDIILLNGELGAGKTEFVKGVCQYFEVEDLVTSPTFTIINQYQGSINNRDFSIFHIDLYRIKKADELAEIGFGECLNDNDSIKFVEWPENAHQYISQYQYSIRIDVDEKNEDLRYITVTKFD
ncbi:MAG TPA: tRNA (adenosine(37)-N6)-threonylcarbamoyltransferase complex ATPase subunit type 1 TsaE [Candidatus Kapabacteria bacterium]|nr:tRNA (adenosine(37)-N6)-threonylcarbamoyltransferase complex ATPase subunit type 1 TsaE [Candidatus Kapabacteria bacterium]